MPIKNASKQDIQSMKNRLSKKQSDRIAEKEMAEAVRMAQKKRPFAQAQAKKMRDIQEIVHGALLVSACALIWNVTSMKYPLIASAVVACSIIIKEVNR